MTKRRSLSPLQRLKIFEAAKGVCHLCGQKIQGHAGEKWEVEHIIPLAMLGTNDADNLAPAHVACHSTKSKTDAGRLSKTLRQRAKHLGAAKPRGFRKPPPGYNPWTRRIEKETR